MTERLDDGSKCTASMNGEHCQHYYYEGIADDEWHDCSGKGRHCCYCETSPPEREVESREPLEWKEKNHTNGDPYEAHSEGGAYFWAWRKDIVKRPSDKWLLWLGGSAIATVRTLDEAKSLAQKLQDVLDGVPDQARAEGRAEPLAEVVAKLEIEKRRVQALIIERDEPSGYLSLLRGEESGLLGAIATVREMGES